MEQKKMAFTTCDGQKANTIEDVIQYNLNYMDSGLSEKGEMAYTTCDGQKANTMEEVLNYNEMYCQAHKISINYDTIYSFKGGYHK